MQAFKRFASSVPSQFRSVIYSSHSLENATGILSVHRYTPKEDLENSVVVRTLAFPINPSDINQLQGVYPSKPEKTLDYGTREPSAIAGNEGVFEVLSVPPHEKSLKAGDWVIPLYANQGTWSDHRVFKDPSDLIKVNGLDLHTAATIGVNGVTAYQLVHDYINWTIGGNEWLIQNAGTSGVSKIVTQVAKAAGINTLSVVRDRDNFDEVASNLERRYGATKVISEAQNNDKVFGKQELPAIMGPNSRVRLALNSVGGKSSSAIARKLENDSLMLTYGGMSKQPVTLPTSLHIFKGLTSKGFWVTENCRRNPSKKVDAINSLVELYKEGKLVSPKSDIITTEFNPNASSDQEFLETVQNRINVSGKHLIAFKW